MWTKSIFLSRTFWLNFLGIAGEITQLLIGTDYVKPGTLLLITNVLNILLRRISPNQPVHIIEQDFRPVNEGIKK